MQRDTINSNEFQAYDAFRNEYTDRAIVLETSERITAIEFDDLGYKPNSTTRKTGDNYNIVLNENPYNNLTKADSWFLGAEINKQVEDSILGCYPYLFNNNTLPDVTDLIPYIGNLNYISDFSSWRWGYTSGEDLTVSTISTVMGLIPGYGLVLGYVGVGGETIYRVVKYGKEFYRNVESYGYSFR